MQLREKTVEVDGTSFKLRELTHAQLGDITKAGKENMSVPLIALSVTEPKLTEEENKNLPLRVAKKLLEAIVELNELGEIENLK